jgi:hypothetical protein
MNYICILVAVVYYDKETKRTFTFASQGWPLVIISVFDPLSGYSFRDNSPPCHR